MLLSRGKRRATGLLVVATAIFVLSTLFVGRAAWLAWVQAGSEASMVGALADWFAVTALFRRPLGLPIPHTAIVVERKDRFGETLGAFVQESFLSPEAVSDRLRAAGAIPRAAAWLADPVRADDLAGRLLEGLARGAELARDDDVHQLLVTLIGQRVEQIPLAPLAGRALEQVLAEGRHQPLLDSALAGLAHYLAGQGPAIRGRLGGRSPWWLPEPIEERLAERMLHRVVAVLEAMAADREHPQRRQLDATLYTLADDLQHSERYRGRGEELKAEILGHPQLRIYAAALWRDVKEQLRTQSTKPDSALRAQLAALISQTGARLRDDPELAAGAERLLDRGARVVLGRFDVELARLVSGTIARWDAADTARRLELLLGPDLQFIRINGTVIGAMTGLALHAVARVLG
ncbi:MAG: DUF445 domain-containing protein [Acidimicrobiaceae bacterium]|nr:DUF445 domain-containing protein [Acidimicrobiaceae bacterium]